VIENNGRAAVVWEVSGHFVAGDHAIIRNNVIRSNGDRCDLVGYQISAGVIVSNAQNILIERNTFGENVACMASWGVRAVNVIDLATRKPPVANVVIRANTLNGDKIQSCGARGVTCQDNT
jgi:Right handed beta helix region